MKEMKADACATALMDKDCKTFWKSVYRISNSKATNHITALMVSQDQIMLQVCGKITLRISIAREIPNIVTLLNPD